MVDEPVQQDVGPPILGVPKNCKTCNFAPAGTRLRFFLARRIPTALNWEFVCPLCGEASR